MKQDKVHYIYTLTLYDGTQIPLRFKNYPTQEEIDEEAKMLNFRKYCMNLIAQEDEYYSNSTPIIVTKPSVRSGKEEQK